VLLATVIVLGVIVLGFIVYALYKRVTSPASQDNHAFDEESGPIAADNIPNAATSQTTYPGQTDSPSPPPAVVEEIPQNKSRHKGATWRREADTKKKERLEEDMMINGE